MARSHRKRRHEEVERQLAIAEGLIERHKDAIRKLYEAKDKLLILQTEEAWPLEKILELNVVSLDVRDGNWRQYG